MRWNLFAASFLALGTLLSNPASAQVDTLSLNFGKIEFEYRAARSGGLPLALDLVVGEQGSVRLDTAPGYTAQMQYAQFPVAPGPQAWLDFAIQGRDLPGGQLLVGIDQGQTDSSSIGGGPHVRVFNVSTGGTAVHSGGAHVLMGDGSVRFIKESVDVLLRGAPASMFNRPGPGEPLVATLPDPAPGQTIELVLKVWDDRGGSTQLPVRIHRPR